MKLDEKVLVYPAHGPGSLCGKGMSSDLYSDIGKELQTNYALQSMNENEFVKVLLENQPFIPKYFSYDVELNKRGAKPFEESLKNVKHISSENEIEKDTIVIDARPQKIFKSGHLKGAINVPAGGKFETWLGSVVSPNEKFYLIAENEAALKSVLNKTAKIGYEINVKGALAKSTFNEMHDDLINLENFAEALNRFTIVDIRNRDEMMEGKHFQNAIEIPLPELRERINEIPLEKEIVVHCAGGYRSAIGSSIVAKAFPGIKVYDLGEAIKIFPVPA
jgi:hydroxyacylglutathione hydrolase